MSFKYHADTGVSLHDCDITEWIFGDDVTAVFGEGFDVFKDCPQNDTGHSKRTGKAAVVMKSGKFVSGEVSLGNTYYAAGEGFHEAECKTLTLEEIPGLGLEVLDFKILPDGAVFMCDVWKNGKDAGFCEIEFSCASVEFQWNEFTDDAWFD